MKSPVVFVSDTRNWRQHPSVSGAGAKTAVRSWAKPDVSSVPQALVSLYSGRREFQNRSLRSGLRAHTYGASFLSRPKSCSQLLAEFVILLPIYPNHKVFVSSIRNSFVPFNHEAPFPIGAFRRICHRC